MGISERITNFCCLICGDMIQTKEYPEPINIKEGFENVSVYECTTQTGIRQQTSLCIRCKDLLTQVIHEEIAQNKSNKK